MPNDKVVVFIRPSYDEVTQIICQWADEIADYATQLGFEVIDIKGKEATRNSVERTLKSRDPKLVVHYGHGTPEALLGQDDERVIDIKNADLLNSRITYTVSCDSAKRLGYIVSRHENTAFVGFEDKFLLPPSFVPAHDLMPFKESVNAVVKALLQGKTVREALEETHVTFSKWAMECDNKTRTAYFACVKKLREIEAALLPDGLEEIRDHVVNALKFRIQSYVLQMLYTEVCKDKGIRKVLALFDNPYINGWLAIEEIGRKELQTATRLFKAKPRPSKINESWGLEDIF